MAAPKSVDLDELLKPFSQRASEAEDRLSRLEAFVSSLKKHGGSGNDEHVKLVSELKSELERVKHERVAEREKALKEVQCLTTENTKLQYRIVHLVRTLNEANGKLAAK